jgi:hypothetical protein
MPYKRIMVRGKVYPIYRSQRKNKKYKVKVKDEWVHFGAKGYSMSPLTKKGDRYCARSYGIKGVNDIRSSNFWARKLWRCKGKKSI